MTGTDTYFLAGGGSGGHLFPGIAVAEELRRHSPSVRIAFLGSQRPVERSILLPTGYDHHALPVEPLRELRRRPLGFLRRNWSALQQAARLLREYRPRCVVGLGGYISVPTVWSAWRMSIPIVLLEQNVIPGAATRRLARFARTICLSFAETQPLLRTRQRMIVTGNPVRAGIANLARLRVLSDDSRRTLLVLGGSQGAESLNDALVRLLPELKPSLAGWNIVHQTGPGRSAAVRERYEQHALAAVADDFFPDVAERYAAAELVISRAGATTLAELACAGCPSLLVPYPFAADQHQAANAEAFTTAGAAVVIPQAASPAETADRLRSPLERLLADSPRRAAMSEAARCLAKPDAARQIAALLQSFAADGAFRAHRPPHTQSADHEPNANSATRRTPSEELVK